MPANDLWYTRCPVPTPLGIAVQLGWFADEFGGDGIALHSLQETADVNARESHFDHNLPSSFRQGGNIPAIWARSRGADTKVIGLSWTDEFQAIVALPDSGIRRAGDLVGRRIGLPVNPVLIDFNRASALRGFAKALELDGYAIGAVAGLSFGAAIALSRLTRDLFAPLFLALRQVPVLSFMPLLVLLLGIEEQFKIAIVAITAFFPVALAAFDGIRDVPKAWFEVAQVYRTPLPAFVLRILVPAALPPIVTGLRIGLTRAWLVLVAAELLAADSGVGQMMEMGRQLFQLDVVLAGIVVSGLIGFTLDFAMRRAEARLARWRTA